uniref:TTF-type domain-containing protein n=1 Tax=Hucho hucho TaxID=62062 RepID=A0A4W5LI17_9TELE
MDKKRSKPSGAQFRKKRKEEEEKRVKDKGALLKYFGAPSGTGQDEEPSTSSATQASSEMISEPQDEEPSTSSATQVSSQMFSEPEDEDEDPFASTSPQQDSSEMPVGASPPNPHTEDEPLSTDPVDWPSVLTDRIRTLVCRGPSEVPPNFVFPRNEGDGRSCHQYFRKTLVSGERIPRSWSVYSERNNRLFCFCCKLFSKKNIQLANSGLTDWKHASSLLTSHNNSPEHRNCMKTWKELAMRIKKGETIDKHKMELMEDKRIRWREVLTRLTAIVQSLAIRNLTLRTHRNTELSIKWKFPQRG